MKKEHVYIAKREIKKGESFYEDDFDAVSSAAFFLRKLADEIDGADKVLDVNFKIEDGAEEGLDFNGGGLVMKPTGYKTVWIKVAYYKKGQRQNEL